MLARVGVCLYLVLHVAHLYAYCIYNMFPLPLGHARLSPFHCPGALLATDRRHLPIVAGAYGHRAGEGRAESAA